MDLNDIQLHGAQLADLYPSSLVELAGEATLPAPAKPVAAQPAAAAGPVATGFLGQHGKRILLVNDDPDSVFIADADLEVLTKIMDRAGIGLADIAIVNWARMPEPDGSALLAELNSEQVLLLGITPDQFGLPALFPHYQIQKLAGRTYLSAPPVAGLAKADATVKKAFWDAFRAWLG